MSDDQTARKGFIRADGTASPWPPPAAVAAALQDCANSILAARGEPSALTAALAAFEGVEKERIHTACCPFAILMRDRVYDQRHVLRPAMPDPQGIYLRDFSRFSLMGVNACYCIAPKDMVRQLEGIGIPAPDRCACAAATAAVRDGENAEKRIAATEKLRRETAVRLRRLGYPCNEGDGPWVDIAAADAAAFNRELVAHGICAQSGENRLRLWLCPPEELERIFYVLQTEKTRKGFRVPNC